MNTLRVMIVDDEPPARGAISALLENVVDVEVVGQIADGLAAVDAIRTMRPDLVFLDVQMPGLGGFQVLDRLDSTERPAVVFVTAYDQHAIRAFELSAVDYLVKPFSDARFLAALEKARSRIRHVDFNEVQRRLRRLLDHALGEGAVSIPTVTDRPSRIGIKVGGDHYFIPIQEILWIEAQGDFVKLAVSGQVHRVRSTLQEIEKRLGSGRFARVHRSFLVNLNEVRKVSSGGNGEFTLTMNDGMKVPVSRSLRGNLADLIGNSGP